MSSPKKKENRFPVFTSSIKREIGKKCTKTRDARAKLLFCQSKPIAFLAFSLMSPSLLLLGTLKGSLVALHD